MTAAEVVVRSVSKSYRRGPRSVSALADVSFEVGRGEFALILGPSGSGKTTLLNLIAALDSPDRGEIIIAGSKVTALPRAAAARYRNERVGIVFQSYNLLPQLTAIENIELPTLPRRRARRRRAQELLDAVGLGDRARHRPPELSGGEQQRVAVARALVNDPGLILADEPIGNLDDESAHRVIELLESACRGQGKTLIVVAHDRELFRPADRIFELRAGALSEIRMAEPGSEQTPRPTASRPSPARLAVRGVRDHG